MTTPVMQQYAVLKRQHPKCLLFFQLGEFYELFYEDAEEASKLLGLTLTRRGKHQGQNIPMCGVPVHTSEGYIARLIRHGRRIAVCAQTESPSKKGKATGPLKREVIRVITPGTLTEDPLLEASRHNFLVSLTFHNPDTPVGVAVADISTGDFWTEVSDVCQLHTLLARLQPGEILLNESLHHHTMLKEIWSEWKKSLTLWPATSFRLQPNVERIQSFFQLQSLKSLGTFHDLEMAAAGALVLYIEQTQKSQKPYLQRPRSISEKSFLHIDAATRRNLELTKTLDGSTRNSLLHTLDHTVTAVGGRLLAMRLTCPLKDLTQIQQRLDSIDFFMEHPFCIDTLRQALRAIPDFERAFSRLTLRRASPRDLRLFLDGFKALPVVRKVLHDHFDKLPHNLRQAFEDLGDYPTLIEHLEKALIDDQLPLHARDGNFIRADYSTDFQALYDLSQGAQREIQSLQDRYIASTKISQLKIKHNQVLGFFIEVPARYAGQLSFDFQLRQSLVSGARYTTSDLQDLQIRVEQSQGEKLRAELTIFEKLVGEIIEQSDALHRTSQAVSVFDVSANLAYIAHLYQYTRPQINTSYDFIVQQGFHPVLRAQKSQAFVANDCCLSQDHHLWLITGPNMAGKSTFLRQNALIALLAHMGSFVPAAHVSMGWIDQIFSRIGASDNLAKGQSTFMMEMTETATILNQATGRSLVIVDEIGRGTSTHDGLAVARASGEYLLETIQARTLFATHYHELSDWSHPKLAYYRMDIQQWEDQLIFLYKLVAGHAEKSYGLHVAQMAGVPHEVLQRAETILSALSSNQAIPPSDLYAEQSSAPNDENINKVV